MTEAERLNPGAPPAGRPQGDQHTGNKDSRGRLGDVVELKVGNDQRCRALIWRRSVGEKEETERCALGEELAGEGATKRSAHSATGSETGRWSDQEWFRGREGVDEANALRSAPAGA